jgi:hypothetical protein
MNVSVWSPPAVLVGLGAFLRLAVWLDRYAEGPSREEPTTPEKPFERLEGRAHA